jgi:hypothetical protein
MKFGKLKSLGHNVADSMASGIGFVIGVYGMDVFGEAAASNEGFIAVDFLGGTTTGAIPSAGLSQAFAYTVMNFRICVRNTELQCRKSRPSWLASALTLRMAPISR